MLNAAAAILQAATPTAAMNALSGQLMPLFDLTWLALADLAVEAFVEVHGEVPSIAWLAAFAEGSQSGADPSNDTTSSGVFVEPIPTPSSPSAAAARPPSGGGSVMRSPCWSW